MKKNIDFISMVDGLETLEDCKPRPAKNYIPNWFKNIPNNIPGTVKTCPSFPDYFSLGYVLPMWMDSVLNYNKETNVWNSLSSPKMPGWEIHQNHQLIDHVTPYFNGSKSDFVFKAVCPWRIITPPGWSVLQLPIFYNFNKDWTILPGVIDTDIHHEINQQVLYHGNGEDIAINRGEAFALYIPFERKKNKLNIRSANKNDIKKISSANLNLFSRLNNSGSYRKMQRERDKDVR